MISDACGAKGMTGGQSMDLASEGKILKSELHSMHKMKTGALIRNFELWRHFVLLRIMMKKNSTNGQIWMGDRNCIPN